MQTHDGSGGGPGRDTPWSLAIDFGTCFTTAATVTDDGQHAGSAAPVALEIENSRCLPSLVCLDDSGVLLTGKAALQRAAHHPDQAERTPKRALVQQSAVLLSGRAVPTADLVAAVLRRVLTEARALHGGREPDRTVLTHPARWSKAERDRLAEAAGRAGIQSPELLPEPVAAALHHVEVRDLPVGECTAVYDLGGGTFDTAVLRRTADSFVTVAVGGDPHLGGEDLDECLREVLGERAVERDPEPWLTLWEATDPAAAAQRARFRQELTTAKEALSATGSVDIAVPGCPRPFLIRSHEYHRAIEPLLVRSYDLLAATVADAGLQLGDVHTVVLTGGASRTPRVSDLIAERTGRLPLVSADPKAVVALGALAGGAAPQPPPEHRTPADAAEVRRSLRYFTPDGDPDFQFSPYD